MKRHQRFIRKHRYWFLALFIVVVVLILYSVGYWVERLALERAKTRMQNDLAFQIAVLKESMNKYTVLGALVARRPDIAEALVNRAPPGALPQTKQLMSVFAGLSGADDIWLVNADGVVLVSRQTVDHPIREEPYFQAAMQGTLGRTSIITDSRERFYIFAIPVITDNTVVGSVVVRVNLKYLETSWALLETPILAVDGDGRAIFSNIPSWQYKYFHSSSQENLKPNTDTYIVEKRNSQFQDHLKLYQPINETSGRHYFHVSQNVALLDWRVHLLSAYDNILFQRNIAILAAFLTIILLAIFVIILMYRWRHSLEEQRVQRAFTLNLEIQVRMRTKELTLKNQQLKAELKERALAERHMRGAQVELAQAAKLAGIGQMSTALANEYNQPLSFIRSYVDNAAAFLSKNDVAAVSENLQHISMLVDKMIGLTNGLRGFVYKTNGRFKRTSIETVIDDVIVLLSPQINKQQVTLHLKPSDVPLFVMSEKGRLSQMLMNLVTNAVDAVTQSKVRKVDIAWYKKQDKAVIIIKDTGPGIADHFKGDVFDAFFTTKKPNEGLGLGLMIVANIIHSLKGTLTVKDEPEYGGVFELRIPLS